MKLPLARDAHVPAVREVNAVERSDSACHGGHVVLGQRAERAGAERHAIRPMVDEPHQPDEVALAADDARQAKNGPRGIIGMDRELHARLCRDRHDALEEVREMLPQLLGGDVAVRGEQCLQLRGVVGRRPAR